MKALLLKVVTNPGVRKAALALVLAVLAALGVGFGTGCAALQGAASTADSVRAAVECRVAVLEPYLGDEAERVVLDIAAGRVDPVALLLNLNVTPKDIIKLAQDFRACAPDAPAPPAAEPVQL